MSKKKKKGNNPGFSIKAVSYNKNVGLHSVRINPGCIIQYSVDRNDEVRKDLSYLAFERFDEKNKILQVGCNRNMLHFMEYSNLHLGNIKFISKNSSNFFSRHCVLAGCTNKQWDIFTTVINPGCDYIVVDPHTILEVVIIPYGLDEVFNYDYRWSDIGFDKDIKVETAYTTILSVSEVLEDKRLLKGKEGKYYKNCYIDTGYENFYQRVFVPIDMAQKLVNQQKVEELSQYHFWFFFTNVEEAVKTSADFYIYVGTLEFSFSGRVFNRESKNHEHVSCYYTLNVYVDKGRYDKDKYKHSTEVALSCVSIDGTPLKPNKDKDNEIGFHTFATKNNNQQSSTSSLGTGVGSYYGGGYTYTDYKPLRRIYDVDVQLVELLWGDDSDLKTEDVPKFDSDFKKKLDENSKKKKGKGGYFHANSGDNIYIPVQHGNNWNQPRDKWK